MNREFVIIGALVRLVFSVDRASESRIVKVDQRFRPQLGMGPPAGRWVGLETHPQRRRVSFCLETHFVSQ